MYSLRFAVSGLIIILMSTPVLAVDSADQWVSVSETRHHLGVEGEPEWQDFAGSKPEGRSLEVKFAAKPDKVAHTLFIKQRDVSQKWLVQVNDFPVGFLEQNENPLVSAFAVPAGTLKEGENRVAIRPPLKQDDIMIEEIRLLKAPREEAMQQGKVRVTVTAEDGAELPCRLTIVDNNGFLYPVAVTPNESVAVRTGTIYTHDGKAEFGVPAGDYILYATRGFEYSLGEEKLMLAAGAAQEVRLKLQREVPTPGLIACDPHVHTLTLSKHGDSTDKERMLTLAGEGVELAVATEHNLFADYAAVAKQLGVDRYFTCAIGNEVTTKVGHFNIFPAANAYVPLPDSALTDRLALLASMRGVPGIQVVIQNHPRDTYYEFEPHGQANFNEVTGEILRDVGFQPDAMEIANSGTMQSDFMQSYRDWFALLNNGQRITALASSDSHDVARYLVGQGRSYVAGNDTDPGKVDVAQVCASIKAGKVAVSLGLLTTMTVDEKSQPGDLALPVGKTCKVSVRVTGPSWLSAQQVELFSNGAKIREQVLKPNLGVVEKGAVEWELPVPPHDAHLVAIASGPLNLPPPYWPIPSPHQPTNRVRYPHVIGSTNPVWLDADRDGVFTPAKGYAVRAVEKAGGDARELVTDLKQYDEVIAAQAAGVWHARGWDVRSAAFVEALSSASPQVREGFRKFAETLPRP